jgi:hypothetical protein
MKPNEQEYASRRGQLLAQQLLLELGAVFVAQPGPDLGIDYLASFEDDEGATKLIGVEVKITQGIEKDKLAFDPLKLAEISRMNIPVLIIGVDAKSGTLYFKWARDAAGGGPGTSNAISIQLLELRHDQLPELKKQILAA